MPDHFTIPERPRYIPVESICPHIDENGNLIHCIDYSDSAIMSTSIFYSIVILFLLAVFVSAMVAMYANWKTSYPYSGGRAYVEGLSIDENPWPEFFFPNQYKNWNDDFNREKRYYDEYNRNR